MEQKDSMVVDEDLEQVTGGLSEKYKRTARSYIQKYHLSYFQLQNEIRRYKEAHHLDDETATEWFLDDMMGDGPKHFES